MRYLSTLFTIKYDTQNNIKIENISTTLRTTIATTTKIVILIIKVTVVMINMITKIRITITITEKKSNTKIIATTQPLK